MTGLITTDLLRRLSKWQGWFDLSTWALLARLSAGVVSLTLTGLAVGMYLSNAVYGTTVTGIAQAFYRQLPLYTRLFNELQNRFIFSMIWVGAYFSIALIRHRYQLELNAVRALFADEPARAQDTVTQLARTLRYTLDSGGRRIVEQPRCSVTATETWSIPLPSGTDTIGMSLICA